MSRGGALRRDASNHVLLLSSIHIRGMGDFAPNLWMLVPIFWQGIIRWGHYGYFEQIEKKQKNKRSSSVSVLNIILAITVVVNGGTSFEYLIVGFFFRTIISGWCIW